MAGFPAQVVSSINLLSTTSRLFICCHYLQLTSVTRNSFSRLKKQNKKTNYQWKKPLVGDVREHVRHCFVACELDIFDIIGEDDTYNGLTVLQLFLMIVDSLTKLESEKRLANSDNRVAYKYSCKMSDQIQIINWC